jgi:hypothetical protein
MPPDLGKRYSSEAERAVDREALVSTPAGSNGVQIVRHTDGRKL